MSKDSPPGWSNKALRHWIESFDGQRVPLSAVERADREGVYPYYGASGVIDHVDGYLFDEPLVLVAEDGANLLLRSTPIAFIARGRYWVNNHAHVLKPRSGSPDYWAYRLASIDVTHLVTGSAQPKLTASALMNMSVSAPESAEVQQSIADLLDRETARIDTLIDEQHRLIEMLRERREAMVTAAVTGQIDARETGRQDHGVAAGDGGVNGGYSVYESASSPWLDRFPAGWRETRFRYVASINGGQVDPREAPWSEMTLIAPNHIESGTGRIVASETAAAQGADSGKYTVTAGQVMYSKIRPALNKVAVATEDCLCSADMYAMSFEDAVDVRFAVYSMLARPFLTFATVTSMRVKMPKINREDLGDAPWLVPPITEQRAIADFLDRETAKIDALIAETEKFIDLARERCSALITAAVTGQIDVRDVA